MNSHEIITTATGEQFDEVRDEYGRFLAQIDEDGEVVMLSYYPPTNLVHGYLNELNRSGA